MRKLEVEEVNETRALAYLLSDWRIGVSGAVDMSRRRGIVDKVRSRERL